jgi:tRNA pseudouridine38-40 synthase
VPRIRLSIEYDGTDFVGWQLQPAGRSVQGELESALADLARRPVRVHGAGRTDAGVHARGQVAHLDWTGRLGPEELVGALNARLGSDVTVIEARAVRDGFDARRDALSRCYLYRILNRASPSPLRRRVTWHLRRRLDLDEMQGAAVHLLGERDFEAFRGAPGGPPPSQCTRRALDELDVRREGDECRLRARSRSFLRHMVRNLVGTLVEVGSGRLDVDEIPEILASRDRSRAGPTAPPHGLCLEWIDYP